jgi:O-antigen biosynthesis protein WbqP
MKRSFDIILAVTALLPALIIMFFIAIAIRITSKGPMLYWSDRVGLNNTTFKMPKFRSMIENTPEVATHLLEDPKEFLSPIGGFIRRTSLDELPQLFSIIKGDMSFVGPRPALFNQSNLIALRSENGLHKILPGLTGWAQVNGRDELSILNKVALEVEYMNKKSFWFDLKILWMTIQRVFNNQGVSH